MREAVSTVQILTKAFSSPGFYLYSQERLERQEHEKEVELLKFLKLCFELLKFSFGGKCFAFYRKSQFLNI